MIERERKTPYRIALLSRVGCALGFLLASAALADGVWIRAGEQQGRGLARADGGDCFVITAAHVVDSAVASGEEIRIVGTGSQAGTATFERCVGTVEDDLVLLRVRDGGAVLCAGGNSERFRDKRGTHLVMRKENGAFDFVAVAILHEGQRDIQIAALGEDGAIQGMMSGAILVSGGAIKGLLIETAGEEAGSRMAKARSLEYLVQQLGPWVKDPAPLENMDEALAILSKATKARPTGDIGQIAAVEQLVRQGSGLEGMDLAGLSFEAAKLDHAELSEALLDGADLDHASLEDADLTSACLGFARLRKTRFVHAALKGALLYFADAEGAVLEGARAARSNWTGALARGADFRGADLTGASFHYADLTGADFRGANLTETLFINAILTDARFEGALVETLDVTAALGDASSFDDAQRGELCGTQMGEWGGWVKLGQWETDTTHRTGRSFRELVSEQFPVVEGLEGLDRCPFRQHRPAGLDTVENRGDLIELVKTRFSLGYGEDLLGKAGRAGQFGARFRDQLRRLNKAGYEQRILAAPGSQHRAFTAAMEKNLSRIEPLIGELPLVREVLFLLAIRAHPERMNANRWQAWARQRLDEEQPWEGGSSHEPKLWPAFFPPDSRSKVLGPEHVELFKRWSEARARTLPMEYTAELPIPLAVRSRLGRLVDEREFEPLPDPFVLSLSDLMAEGQEAGEWLSEVRGAGVGFQLERDGTFEYVLAFSRALASYRLEIPLTIAKTLARGKRRAELRVRIEDIAAVERELPVLRLPQVSMVLRCEVLGFRLLGEAGAAYPP